MRAAAASGGGRGGYQAAAGPRRLTNAVRLLGGYMLLMLDMAPDRVGDRFFAWIDEEERLRIIAEIEVIVARDLYRLTATEMDHVLDTFPSVERRQTERFGTVRTP